MKKYGLILTVMSLLSACGDSGLAQQQYTDGAQAARDASCDCDPFFSDTQSDASQAASVSPQWADGYLNACVDLRRECASDNATR